MRLHSFHAAAAAACCALVALFVVACSSDTTASGDAGARSVDGASEGASSSLPSCVTSGLQCQPKGCNPGYEPLAAYDCGSGGGSCCGKSIPKLDASVATDAASVDATID